MHGVVFAGDQDRADHSTTGVSMDLFDRVQVYPCGSTDADASAPSRDTPVARSVEDW